MQSYFMEELLRLFFNNCNNDPQVFVSNFDESNLIIAFNFSCEEHRFTHVSNSFVKILGYNKKNILNNGNFTAKIVHPQDKDVIGSSLKKSIVARNKPTNENRSELIVKAKCRAKHIRGYWKYFVIYTLDNISQEKGSDKIGLIVDDRIRSKALDSATGATSPMTVDKTETDKESDNHHSSAKLIPISPRENEILELISNGLVTREIAKKLNISDSTVVSHRKNLIFKLNVRNTAELIKTAAHHMLI